MGMLTYPKTLLFCKLNSLKVAMKQSKNQCNRISLKSLKRDEFKFDTFSKLGC